MQNEIALQRENFAKAVAIANRLELMDSSIVEHIVALIRNGRGADLDREIAALNEIALLLNPTGPLHHATEMLLASFRSGDADLIERAWPKWISQIAAPAAYSLLPDAQAELTATKHAKLAHRQRIVEGKRDMVEDIARRDAQIYADYLTMTAGKATGACGRAKKMLAKKHHVAPNTIRNIVRMQGKLPK